MIQPPLQHFRSQRLSERHTSQTLTYTFLLSLESGRDLFPALRPFAVLAAESAVPPFKKHKLYRADAGPRGGPLDRKVVSESFSRAPGALRVNF